MDMHSLGIFPLNAWKIYIVEDERGIIKIVVSMFLLGQISMK